MYLNDFEVLLFYEAKLIDLGFKKEVDANRRQKPVWSFRRKALAKVNR